MMLNTGINKQREIANSVLFKKFSFPYRTGDMPDLAWFKRHQDLINDVYINPDIFGYKMQGMNGFDAPEEKTLEFLKSLKALGIKISATFNNIFTDMRPEAFLSLDEEYKHLIDILIVPDHSWLSLKKDNKYNIEFRNTVIMDITKEELDRGDLEGYDCIYIHGDNLRNLKAYQNYNNLGAVVNFNDCVSWCPIKKNHYAEVNKEKFDNDGFCPVKKMNPETAFLKVNRIPPFLSEYIFYSDYLKIFKLQGRGSTDTFEDAINIIENIHNGNELLTKDARRIHEMLPGLKLHKWLYELRNCGGDCRECSFCDELIKG